MGNWEDREFKVFDLFRDRWALVTAGTMERFNTCTVGWGSLGTLWTRPGKSGSVATVYLYETRYTREFLTERGKKAPRNGVIMGWQRGAPWGNYGIYLTLQLLYSLFTRR